MHANRFARLTLVTISTLGVAATPSHAQVTTYVTNFTKNGDLQTNLNAKYPTGLFNTTAFGGVSFDITADANGNNFAGIENSNPLTISVNLPGVTDVYTLINGFAPSANQTGETVTFAGSGGASETFTLINGVDVRDYFQGSYANTVNGTTTQQILSVIGVGGANTGGTPQSSSANQGSNGTYVLDAQHFTLNSSFTNQMLQTITISNGSGSLASIVSGVTVRTAAVPEPGSLALLSLGLVPLGAVARRRWQAK